ncbi:hypothetical protein BKA61DRAFT_498163, partial [Leptodontidium sp. MPI-SDFR-AT-0119]
MLIPPQQIEPNEPTIENRMSISTINTWSSSSSSAYTQFDDRFSSPRLSVATTSSCSVCGFTRWHALMVHARSMSCDDFLAANRRLCDLEKVDFAGNSTHYLMIAGVGINYLNQIFDRADTCQNFFGQNPLHVLNPQDLGDQLISLLDWYRDRCNPPGALLSQRDIYCRTPLHTLLQQPLERPMYQRVLRTFPSAVSSLHSLDTSGRSVFEMVRQASLKVKTESPTDFVKIQIGITEARLFLSEAGFKSSCTQTYGFHDIARGARGIQFFGMQFQCQICNQTNAHSDSYLDQMECAVAYGRDRNAPDDTGLTPAHLLVTHARCNNDPERTPETPSQTAALFRKLIPETCPERLEVLHALDPEGNSLVHNIAIRGLDEVLEYVLSLETYEKQRWMVNSIGKTRKGKQLTLAAVKDEIYYLELCRLRVVTPFISSKLDHLTRVKQILLSAGA